MKRLFFTIITTICASSLFALTTVKGKITDTTGEPVPYATIVLMDADSTVFDGAISQDDGSYIIENVPNGTYQLAASFIGYASESREVILSESVSEQNFTLIEESSQLETLEVTAKRPLVENQMDKIVMNVSQSAFAIGSSGEDLLKKAPGVNIDKDGNVTVNGKSVEVYIDGRPSYLSGQQLAGMLKGTDGSTIDKIEIITNPSAKYDAAGEGGIINIKLKRNMMKGLNGSVSGSYGGMYFKNTESYNQSDFASLNLNYRGKNTYTFVSATQVYSDFNVNLLTSTSQMQGSDTLRQQSNSLYDIKFQYYNVRLGNDWYIDEKNTLGFIFQVPIMLLNQTSDWQSASSTMLNNKPLEQMLTNNIIQNPSVQYTANLNYTHVFSDSLSRELTLNADYNHFDDKTDNLQQNRNTIYNLPDTLYQNSGLNIRQDQIAEIYSFKADFQTKFWKTGMIEAGVKYALSRTDNEMITDTLAGNDFATASSQKTEFDYSEHVAAAYISVAKQFGPKWSLKLGLRGEYTNSAGNWISADTTSRASYFDVFPTAFLGYNPTEKWRMSASYTRRIKRPSYYQLNPFVTYVDAHTSQKGNTELKPEYNNDVELKFGYSQYVSLDFIFAYTQDMMNNQPTLFADGSRQNTWINFGSCVMHGANLSLTEVPIVKTKKDSKTWLALTLNAGLWHFISTSGTNDYQQRSLSGDIYACLTTYLPYDIQMSIDGWYSPASKVAYNYQLTNYYLGFSARKNFLNNRLILNLQVKDLLRSSHYRSEALGLGEGNYAKTEQIVNNQAISIGLTYMFGTQQHVKQRRVGNQEENSRLGSGGSGF